MRCDIESVEQIVTVLRMKIFLKQLFDAIETLIRHNLYFNFV